MLRHGTDVLLRRFQVQVIRTLCADDICHGAYQNERGQRCLSGQLAVCFPRVGLSEHMTMYERLLVVINKNHAVKDKVIFFDLPTFNDSHTLEECATVWNECFAQEIGKV